MSNEKSIMGRRVLVGFMALVACGRVEDGPSATGVSTKTQEVVVVTGSPAVARMQHTLGLRGSKVYAVGGNPSLTPSVEIFDSATNAFTAGPALITNRRSHAMVTLADGTFIVFAGIDAAGITASCEKLAPGASAWQALTPMPRAGYGQNAIVLPSGQVLVSGGLQLGDTGKAAWLYDPTLNTWATTGSMITARMRHASARLPDGRILVLSNNTQATEAYTPSTGTWSPTGSTAHLMNDLIAITSGQNAGTILAGGTEKFVERFSPESNAWQPYSQTNASHTAGRFVGLASGAVIVFGEAYGAGTQAGLVIEYLNPSGGWAAFGEMPASRDSSPGVQLPDGRVLVVGGSAFPAGGGNAFARADAFTWALFNTCTPTTCAASGATCGTISNGCGGTLSCGTCATGQTCSSANVCVASCTPTTCAASGATCGTIGNGCGGTLSCGTCGAGSTCTNNACVCTPKTCADLGLTCGTASNGCGGTLTCGPACTSVTATYDATLKAPACATTASSCSAVTTGRGAVGPETNAPNTLGSSCADDAYGVFHSDESLDGVRVRATSGLLRSGGAAQVEVDVWAWAGFGSDSLDVFITTNPSAPVWSLVATRTATKSGAQTITVPLTLPVSASARYAVRAQFRYGGSATSCISSGYNDRDDLVFTVAP